jgi:hypothetical protein
MKITTLRINYNGNTETIFRELFAPLQRDYSSIYFYRWRIHRSWENGPHFNLDLDADDAFFGQDTLDILDNRIQSFLIAHPSPDVDVPNYLNKQIKLKAIEASDMDPSWTHVNNSYALYTSDVTTLAIRYESLAQWESIFETEMNLRPHIIAQWQQNNQHKQYLIQLLTLLACTMPPFPSSEAEINEYNGFLSFYANYRFWHHTLPETQQEKIQQKFSADYSLDEASVLAQLQQLIQALQGREESRVSLASLMRTSFLNFMRLALAGEIHERSPYPRASLKPQNQLSPFHQRLFYTESGQAKTFVPTFVAYRWLLNIIYRNLPLFDTPPIARQYFNFSLDKIQKDHHKMVCAVRESMLQA